MANKKQNAKNVNVLILRTAGTNCDQETGFAFARFGAKVDFVHINRLIKDEVSLHDYHIMAIPGGFTYGDDIESGRILANELKVYLAKDIKKFIGDRKLIIGICNGFQILVKAGLLPGQLGLPGENKNDWEQTATLTNNDSGKFEDRWTHLQVSGDSAWTRGMNQKVYFPVAHAEGKFIPLNQNVLEALKRNRQIIFRYCGPDGNEPVYPDNPNGSIDNIAGITDVTGHILGLMPHPERHFLFTHHPSWMRASRPGMFGDGAKIFENGVEYVKKDLLNL